MRGLAEKWCHGYGNGAFEDSEDDGGAVVEEFFPESSGAGADAAGGNTDAQTIEVNAALTGKPSLAEKLEVRAATLDRALA